VNSFNWSEAAAVLAGFGGKPIILHVPKTGLPFYDTLRLYGAIDLYIGLREDVLIHDAGTHWKIQGHSRENQLRGKDISAFRQVWKKKKPVAEDYCSQLRSSLASGTIFQDKFSAPANKAFVGLDATLQSGIRGISAASYDTLRSGETSKRACLADIPLSEGLLAFVGKKRMESLANIVFLPIFEGKVDFSKVISPLRAWLGIPNALCAQALALLALRTSLFVDGYQDRFTAVVYNTTFASRKGFNYSGLITIDSTAIGKMTSSEVVAHTYRIFRALVSKAWTRQGQSTELTTKALDMTYWLMQPLGKHLSSMITSQEQLRRGIERGDRCIRQPTLFDHKDPNYVREVFEMTYGGWEGDHEAVRKLAKAVASAIQWARGRDSNGNWLKPAEQRKNWYDEVVMLRSAPSAKAFIERVMILVEQGHREHGQIGTAHRQEDFDPKALLESVGNDRTNFEAFRDLFRMYLVQESTYRGEGETTVGPEEKSEARREDKLIEGGAE
jgi:hypothetical protein